MRRAAALLGAGSLLLAASPAAAQTAGSAGAARGTEAVAPPRDPNELVSPPSLEFPPVGRVRTGENVLAIARRVKRVRQTVARYPGHTTAAYLKGASRWQVSFFRRQRRGEQRKEIAQVLIDDRSGAVLEAWTGFQVPWTMARGYPGAFGRKVNALYVWIPLCLLFVLPFVDPRRPFRLLHLDLLVIAGLFSASLAFFNHGKIGVSVPLAYPPLVYLLARMLFAARPQRGPPRPVRLLVPVSWLTVGLIFLVGFRVGLNVVNSNVIDVGYAGVIGADRLMDGTRLYGSFPAGNEHGDTYGPVNYYAYVPFEQALPWSGAWDDLPAAHGAAVFFDLLTILLLWLLGRRLRGPPLGIALAYAWAACPFTLFALSSNSNDSFLAALVVGAVLVAASPPARGALAALAALTKFAPLALVPLLASYRDPDRRTRQSRPRELAVFALVFAATAAVCLLPVLLDGGLRLFYERTVEYQNERGSPFSIWGFVGGLDGAQTAVQVAAALLAAGVAFRPRERDAVTLSALAAAVLIAVQLGVTHWFYLYIVWFLPLVLVALLARGLEPRDARGTR